jgi:hypothetical protein
MPTAVQFVELTPEPAREAISCLYKHLPSERKLLRRLASETVMNDVWTGLRGKEDQSGEIICRVIDTVRLVESKRPPSPKKGKAAFAKWALENPPSITFETIAGWALWLRDEMIATRDIALSIYPELKLDDLLETVDYIARAYNKMHEQHEQYWKAFQYPHSRKASARNRAEIAFSKMMFQFFNNQFGRPLDTVVAALTQVVFNIKKSVSEETIRKRRSRR